MLTAAVCGNVFASPNASQVKYAINLVDNQKGYVCIFHRRYRSVYHLVQHSYHRQVCYYTIKGYLHLNPLSRNYTGDVLSFGLSREQHAAAHPEQKGKVRFLVVGDDVAVGKTQGSIVGRRFVSLV
jgi:dihydroxyacetone kinase